MKKKIVKYLSICECPVHNFKAITIEDDHGGVRVTPSKCCGRWDTVHRFKMKSHDWRELAEYAQATAEEVED